jgi:bacteriorhodopsin
MFFGKLERIRVVVALVLIPIGFLLTIFGRVGLLVEDAEHWGIYSIGFAAALMVLPAITSQIIRLLDRR